MTLHKLQGRRDRRRLMLRRQASDEGKGSPRIVQGEKLRRPGGVSGRDCVHDVRMLPRTLLPCQRQGEELRSVSPAMVSKVGRGPS